MKFKEIRSHFFYAVGWLACVALLVILSAMITYKFVYETKILPRVVVAGLEISNMTGEEAIKKLSLEFERNPNLVEIKYQGETLAETSKLRKDYDFDWAIEQAWNSGRSGNPLTQVSERIKIFFKPKLIDLPIDYDIDALDGIVGRIVSKIAKEARLPKVVVEKNGEIKVDTGSDGLKVDEDTLKKNLILAIGLPGKHVVEVPATLEIVKIDDERMNLALEEAKRWKGKTLRLYYGDFNYNLKTNDVLDLISLTEDKINEKELNRLLTILRPKIETESRNAVFNFDQGKVIEFSPEINGVRINETELRSKLTEIVNQADRDGLEVPVIITEAKIKTGDVNNLGIKTLIGVGTSKFAHSIPNRIHNLTLASSRLNGALVAPGETFSLGQTIGDISRATGYREAYVISEGRTVLGDGGGVCQVSTTLFRAAMNAGLPIVERRPHAYRVAYYEQDMGPGYDATVFFPSSDLKFVNDTPGHILIQTKVEPKKFSMRYEIYGTDDGRVASISAAKTYSQVPPLPTIYQDDPTLPVGTTKQVDWSAWGAKVSFDYKVVRNGETLQDRTFYSTYQPWAAIYLKGTGQP